jgi:hypothetical protein
MQRVTATSHYATVGCHGVISVQTISAVTMQHLVDLRLRELLDLDHVVPRRARGCTETAPNVMLCSCRHESHVLHATKATTLHPSMTGHKV